MKQRACLFALDLPARPARLRSKFAMLLAAALLALPAAAESLPDTGQDACYDGTSMVTCSSANTGDSSSYPRQDGRHGRDPAFAQGAFAKTGGGQKGFDYIKLDASGNALAMQNGTWTYDGSGHDNGSEGAGTKWSCVTDNITDLTWEVKTHDATAGLREMDHQYTWYNSDASTNGGNAGGLGNNTCNGTLSGYGNQCNTQNYIAAINAANLCGFNDWRLPSSRELHTLVHAGTYSPSIDGIHFPNTRSACYWSSDTYALDAAYAWLVEFVHGDVFAGWAKTISCALRLVRGAQL